MTRRSPRRTRRRLALALRWAAFACVLGLLAACASMPSGGGVREVSPDDAAGTEADEQQVRVFGVPPQPNESPRDLVDGFLEALTSDEPEYQTARQYLTPEASKNWRPEAGIKIVDKTPNATVAGFPAPEATSTIVSVDSKQIGSVDDQFAYEPRPVPKSPDSVELSLVKNENGQWRIAELPNGLMMSLADFQRIYTPVRMYWFADSYPQPMLVPDPIYLRTRNALVTTLVKKLLQGPNKWIAPVVRTSIPANTELLDHNVTVDDSGYVTVRLSGKPDTIGAEQCKMMGSQLLYTLSQVAKVESVELKTDDGPLCTSPVSKQVAAAFDPAAPEGAAGATGYFLASASGAAYAVRAGSEDASPVLGQFGDISMHLNEIAVDRNEQRIAGTSRNDLELWVSDLNGKSPPKLWATAAPDHTFKSLTWDGHGGLWVLEEDNRTSRRTLFWVNEWSKIQVPVQGLDGGRIVSVRMSPDGTRASMFVEYPDDGQVVGRMVMGRVNRLLVDGEARPMIDGLRLVMPDIQDVKSQSWQGASRILVLGRLQDASSQPQFVDIDGSNVMQISSPSGVESIAAPDGREQPLLAGSSDELIYRQEPGGAWKALPGKGRHYPVYPG